MMLVKLEELKYIIYMNSENININSIFFNHLFVLIENINSSLVVRIRRVITIKWGTHGNIMKSTIIFECKIGYFQICTTLLNINFMTSITPWIFYMSLSAIIRPFSLECSFSKVANNFSPIAIPVSNRYRIPKIFTDLRK